jgi:NitT/TauT family transport system substrate-binding protein
MPLVITRRLASIAMAGALLLAAGSMPALSQTGRTAITVSAVTPADTLPFYYAIQKGMFERAGLDITVIPSTSGGISLVAVAGGAAQIGYSNVLSQSQAFLKGLPIAMIVPGAEYTSAQANVKIAVAPDSSIRTAKDLEGKTVSVTGLHDLLAIGVTAWLDKNGADPSKVKFVEISPASMFAALQQKRIDAAAMYEPYLSAAESTGGIRTIAKPYDAIAPRFMSAAWFGNATWMKEHRDAALRFAQVMNQAQEYTNAHYEELHPLIAEFSKVPLESIKKSPVVKELPGLQAPLLQPQIDLAAKYKELNNSFRAQEIFFPGAP